MLNLLYIREAEIMFGVAMNFYLRIEIITARQFALDCGLITIEFEGVDPAHAVFGAGE